MVLVTRSGMEASRFLPRALSLMNPLCPPPVHVCVGVKPKTKNQKHKKGGWKTVMETSGFVPSGFVPSALSLTKPLLS